MEVVAKKEVAKICSLSFGISVLVALAGIMAYHHMVAKEKFVAKQTDKPEADKG